MAGLIGQRFGPYEIISLLGEGGMAAVYRARQTLAGSVHREVAIKVIQARLANREEFVVRFQREAQTIMSLSHAHILKVFDFGQQADLIYLVMELLRGGSLAERIEKGALPLAETSRLLDQIASALDFAHSRGIIHRDLKPQNVLLDESGNTFLGDFGIVKLLNESNALTQSGALVGTPAYMAPEQWQTGAVDARVDIYSLGVMLYQMVSGRIPFAADTPFQMMHMHIYERPPSVRSQQTDLPAALDQILDRALAKNPEERYQSAGALASDFKAVVANTPRIIQPPPAINDLSTGTYVGSAENIPTAPPQLPPSVPTFPRRRSRIIAGLIGMLIVAAAAVFLIVPRLQMSGPGTTPTSNTLIAAVPTTALSATATNMMVATSSIGTSPASPSPLILAQANTATLVPPTNTPMAQATTPPANSPLPPTIALIVSSTALPPTATLVPPTVTATLTDTVTIAPTFTPLPPSATPTNTPDNTPSPSFTPTVTGTPTTAPTFTPLPPSATLTNTPDSTPSPTTAPTLTPTIGMTATRGPGDMRTDTAGIAQIYVPAGCFAMGSQGNDKDELPIHRVCITHSFWLDRYEISVDAFAQYLTRTGAKEGKASPANFDSVLQPRVNVSWLEATAYAKWRACRLPTEAEWEWASRGPQTTTWPWGDDRTPDKANTAETKPDRTADVNGFDNGRSWVGANQMAGNVWEWVNDWYDEKYYTSSPANDPQGPTSAKQFRILRGGSFRQDLLAARGSDRYWAPPDGRADFVGFRVACSAE